MFISSPAAVRPQEAELTHRPHAESESRSQKTENWSLHDRRTKQVLEANTFRCRRHEQRQRDVRHHSEPHVPPCSFQTHTQLYLYSMHSGSKQNQTQQQRRDGELPQNALVGVIAENWKRQKPIHVIEVDQHTRQTD